jgi:hypothetical protein
MRSFSDFVGGCYSQSISLIYALDSDGDFVVVWMSLGSVANDQNGYSIQGQSYNSAGTAQGSQFQVNTYRLNNQNLPAVAMDSNGDYVAVWQSWGGNGSDTSGYSVQGQRFMSEAITPTPTSTPSPTSTNTPTPTNTATASVTNTPTPSITPTTNPTLTATATDTPTPTLGPTNTPFPTDTPTLSTTETPTPTTAPADHTLYLPAVFDD